METLDSIIREYLIEEGRDNLHEYPRYLQMAIRGLKDLDYDVSGVPRVEVLEIDNLGRATLPSDVVNVYRIGFMNSDKRIVEIFKDERIMVNYDQQYNCTASAYTKNITPVSNPSVSTSPTIDWSNHYRNGEPIGRYYGNEGGGAYSYNIDLNHGVIEFSSNVSGSVIIQYLGDPRKVNGKHRVHPFLVEPIKAWIEYASKRRKPNVSKGEVQFLFNQYVLAKGHAAVRFFSESLGNLYNASRKTFNQSAKY